MEHMERSLVMMILALFTPRRQRSLSTSAQFLVLFGPEGPQALDLPPIGLDPQSDLHQLLASFPSVDGEECWYSSSKARSRQAHLFPHHLGKAGDAQGRVQRAVDALKKPGDITNTCPAGVQEEDSF